MIISKNINQKIRTLILLSTSILLLLTSCQNETIDTNNIEILKNNTSSLEIECKVSDFTFYFNSEENEGNLVSKLTILKDKKQIFISQNEIDSKVPAYKLTVYKEVIKNAKKLKKGISIS